MSIVKEDPGTAFVKGGLFKKFGVDIPKPNYEVFVRNKEDWEEVRQGLQVLR